MGYFVAVAYGLKDFKRQVLSYVRGEAPDRLDFIPGMRDTEVAQ